MAEETQYTLGKLQASVDGIKELLLSRLTGLESRVTALENKVSELERLVWKAFGGGVALATIIPTLISWLTKDK